MRVLHITNSDKHGGASIAAYRLHKALLKKGIDSKMLVLDKITDEKEIFSITENKIQKKILFKIRSKLESLSFFKYKNRRNKIIFSQGKYGGKFAKNSLVKNVDIIHLHWINDGVLKIEEILKFKKMGKKIVWTLHDMWPFTGGCHYSGNCKKYEGNCGNCPILDTAKDKDITRKIYTSKKRIYEKVNFNIVGCSEWIAECALKSTLLKKENIKVLPNIIDNSIYKKIDKSFVREILNLDNKKKYILFGAVKAIDDKRKGFEYLKEALYILDKKYKNLKNDVEILIFGSSFIDDLDNIPFNVRFLGRIHDEITLSLIYNSANVFVCPSLEENLANTVNESLNCETPVVAFNVGGMKDMIVHKKNGYLAEYKNIEELVKGIYYCLNYNGKLISKFNNEEIIKKFIEFYQRCK